MRQDLVPLFISLGLTVLFIVFSTGLYEVFYHGTDEFANEMDSQGLYLPVALLTSVVTWIGAGVYYLLIDRYPSKLVWALFWIIVVLAAPFTVFYYCNGLFLEQDIDFASELQRFALVNAVVAGVLYLVASFGIKNLSSNCATTPC